MRSAEKRRKGLGELRAAIHSHTFHDHQTCSHFKFHPVFSSGGTGGKRIKKFARTGRFFFFALRKLEELNL